MEYELVHLATSVRIRGTHACYLENAADAELNAEMYDNAMGLWQRYKPIG